jgi:hypothetical protein
MVGTSLKAFDGEREIDGAALGSKDADGPPDGKTDGVEDGKDVGFAVGRL